MFASGKIVCTGTVSETAAHVAVIKYFDMVNRVAPEAVLLDMCIENIVGTGYVGHGVDLRAAYEWLREYGCVKTMFSPELFPGLRFQIQDIARDMVSAEDYSGLQTKVLAFQEGNVVICGAKTRDDLKKTWRITRAVLARFRKDEAEVRSPAHYLFSSRRPRLTAHLAQAACARKRHRRR